MLTGSEPADLPGQQPAAAGLLSTLREARPIRLTFPPAFIAQATRVVE